MEPTEPIDPASTGSEADEPRRRGPSRKALTLALIPMIVITVVSWLGSAFRPRLIDKHPAFLLASNPAAVNMTLVSAKVGIFTFVFVVLIRRLVADPSYFMLGRWYGDSAVAWLQKRSPDIGELAKTIEGWFPRWGRLLVLLYPHPVVMVLAGASTMSFVAFIAYDFIGTLIVIALVREFGNFADPVIKPLTSFISRYSWQLTAFSVALAVFYVWNGHRKGNSQIESIGDIQRDLESGAGDEPEAPPAGRYLDREP